MNVIPSPLEVLLRVRMELQLGRSLTSALKLVLEPRTDSFSKSLKAWQHRIEAGQSHCDVLKSLSELTSTPGRSSLVDLLERGLKGFPIDPLLSELETELFELARDQFERHLQVLPLKLMAPLTLFILPAVFILVIGPLLFTWSQYF